MSKNTVLFTALFLSAVLSILNLLGLHFYFYWIYWWFDVVMHFMAGIIGGLATYWVLVHSGFFWKQGKGSPRLQILAVFICVFIVGVAWEVMEYVSHTAGSSQESYAVDTMNDLILDSAGAIIAALIAGRKRNG